MRQNVVFDCSVNLWRLRDIVLSQVVNITLPKTKSDSDEKL